MSDTTDKAVARAEGTDELMPVLSGLDDTATRLEASAADGERVTAGDITEYELQAQHARHLLHSHGLDPADVQDAEAEYRCEGAQGFTERGLDHAQHVRHFEPTPRRHDETEQPLDEELEL